MHRTPSFTLHLTKSHHISASQMAKTPKPKPTTKPSPHSRSSRRATSPALEGNLDKSLRNLPRPSPPTRSNPILAPQPGTGISKKKHGGKVLKRKQRVRVEQGREKAEIRRGKLERKVERSERRGRNVSFLFFTSVRSPWDMDCMQRLGNRICVG